MFSCTTEIYLPVFLFQMIVRDTEVIGQKAETIENHHTNTHRQNPTVWITVAVMGMVEIIRARKDLIAATMNGTSQASQTMTKENYNRKMKILDIQVSSTITCLIIIWANLVSALVWC